jgi:hypothetical protein
VHGKQKINAGLLPACPPTPIAQRHVAGNEQEKKFKKLKITA